MLNFGLLYVLWNSGLIANYYRCPEHSEVIKVYFTLDQYGFPLIKSVRGVSSPGNTTVHVLQRNYIDWLGKITLIVFNSSFGLRVHGC